MSIEMIGCVGPQLQPQLCMTLRRKLLAPGGNKLIVSAPDMFFFAKGYDEEKSTLLLTDFLCHRLNIKKEEDSSAFVDFKTTALVNPRGVWLFNDDETNFYVFDLRITLGQIWFFAGENSLQEFHELLYSHDRTFIEEEDNNQIIDIMGNTIIESPKLQVWELCYNNGAKEWGIKKFKINLTKIWEKCPAVRT